MSEINLTSCQNMPFTFYWLPCTPHQLAGGPQRQFECLLIQPLMVYIRVSLHTLQWPHERDSELPNLIIVWPKFGGIILYDHFALLLCAYQLLLTGSFLSLCIPRPPEVYRKNDPWVIDNTLHCQQMALKSVSYWQGMLVISFL